MASSDYLLHFTRQGSGSVLVLIHGVAGSSRIWDPVVAKLARHFDVVRVDLLGYGLSPKPHIEYTPEVHVNAIRATLRHCGIKEPFTMAGLSMGTLLVLEYARRWPDEVRKVLCIGFPYYRDEAEARQYLRHSTWARLALERPMLGYALAAMVMGVGRRSKLIAGKFSRLYTPEMAQDSARGTYHAFRTGMLACMIYNRADTLLAATAMTKQDYLHGALDRWTNAESLEVALGNRMNCQLTILPDTEHNTVITAPDATVAWIVKVMKAA